MLDEIGLRGRRPSAEHPPSTKALEGDRKVQRVREAGGPLQLTFGAEQVVDPLVVRAGPAPIGPEQSTETVEPVMTVQERDPDSIDAPDVHVA